MLKPLLLGGVALLLATVAAAVLWFHARRPPDCTDPRTIALVRQSLVAHSHLPDSVTLDHIRTVAGGIVALRFVCQADVGGIDLRQLPPGMPLPGLVHYTSRLTADRSRHEVTVELDPLLKWELVQ